MSSTALHRNPFWVLGASIRDDSRRLIELADERSLTQDSQACQKARADLTNPRTRLAAELSWLPGLSPTRAIQLTEKVLKNPLSIVQETGLPPLPHANLLAAAFESLDVTTHTKAMADLILKLADLTDQCTPERIIRDLNEDRSIAGFPAVKLEVLEKQWHEHTQYYRTAMKGYLDRLPTPWIIEAMTLAVDRTTQGGTLHAPAIIDDLVGTYELESQRFLEEEAQNVEKLVGAIRAEAQAKGPAVNRFIDVLSRIVRQWDAVAQPIQLSAQARGLQHALSQHLAYTIRGLALTLTNDHNCMAESQRLTELIASVFAELPEVLERADEDAAALQRLLHDQQQTAAQLEEWKHAISCEAEFGTFIKNTFRLSAEGIAWKKQFYPLSTITRIRYGGLNQSGALTFTVGFGNATSDTMMEFRGEELFTTIIGKLWRAVGPRLAADVLNTLRKGQRVTVGQAILTDEQVLLIHHKFFGDDYVWCSWHDVQIWTSDGDFYIGLVKDDKVYVRLSYIRDWNTHVLEQMLRIAFKHPGGFHRLSDTFGD
jgi:hypothetical protein